MARFPGGHPVHRFGKLQRENAVPHKTTKVKKRNQGIHDLHLRDLGGWASVLFFLHISRPASDANVPKHQPVQPDRRPYSLSIKSTAVQTTESGLVEFR